MLGREPARRERSAARPAGAGPRLEARGLSRRGEFRDVSFELREGEVLGVLGVVGSGKTELARAVSGATRLHGGELYARGRPVDARDPRRAAAAGIGMAPEDRKAHGLVIDMELYKNVSLASLGRMSRRGIIRAALERSEVERVAKALGTKYASLSQRARCLSGGNQQKLVLARWLLASPDVLVLDEPTRGVDVGAKAEIYGIVRRLALEGKSVLYLSGEAQEMLEVADRVMVMQRGRVVATHEEPPSEDELLAEMLEVADGR